ncbi:TolC family protein [Mangrovimonas sp. YM274]|uniref:TolC family protein n=1 Tax=Mangrovimonas sp. YM274 TaxID=3070660 RepID=UPI0027DD92DF|nr:TolC family protein [Mangrovimonas sp. YM274]WMI68644.1 TolC family protein [Mangrovimonas sp. YM274]
MKHNLILTLSLLCSLTFFGQEETQVFSLQEAIDYALEHNRASINASRDIEAAEKQKWETTASGLPQIDATVDYQNWIKQQVSLLPGELAGGEPGTFIPVTFGTKHSVNATATLNQKIFDGSYLVGLQSAKVYLEISQNAKVKTDLEVRQAVINAYVNVLFSEEALDILNKNLAVLQKNLEETTKIFENGLEEEESVEQLQITLSGIESQLNNTRRLKVLAYQMFNITLGLDLNTDTTLTDDLAMLTEENMDLGILQADENIENTIDYKIAKNDMVSKELLLKLEKSKFLPTLNAFVNGGYLGFNDEFGFLRGDQQWFGTSLFGLSLRVPIFSSGMRSASTQRARINYEKAQTDLTEIEQQLKLQIASAKSDYQLAMEEYENKKKNLNLAERIETKNETKFFEGVGSSFELRQAQTQLYTAQEEYLQAMMQVINTKAELETSLNTVLIN